MNLFEYLSIPLTGAARAASGTCCFSTWVIPWRRSGSPR